MATEALKTTAITNMDATPPVRPTSGKGGGAGRLESVFDTITATTGVTSGSTYRMVRVPSNAIIRKVWAWLDVAVTTFTCDIGVSYSDTTDGRSTNNSGAAISAALFGSAVALATVVTMTEYSTESGTYTGAKRKQELWQAAGLSSDPGGWLDIVFTNTAINSGAPVLNAEIEYVLPPG